MAKKLKERNEPFSAAWLLVKASARRNWPLITGGLAVIALMELAALYSPQLIKQAVDQLALGAATAQSLLGVAVYLAVLALAVTVLRMLGRPMLMTFGRRVERDVRDSLGMRLLGKPQSFFDRQNAGSIMARASYDLNNMRLASGYGLQAAWDTVLTLALALAYMLWLSPLLTVLAGLPMLTIPWLTRRQSILFHRCHQGQLASFSDLSKEANDTLSAIRLVKVHDLLQAKTQGFKTLALRHQERNLELARVSALYLPVMSLVTHLSQAVVWGGGGALAVLGYISAGDIVAFSAYVAMMKSPLIYSGYLINLAQRARSSAQRLQEALDGPDLERAPEKEPPCPASQVTVDGLSFTYPGESSPALSGVGLDLPPGAQAALVGPVGSGKSTLLGIIARLYQPPPGTVRFGERELADMPEAQLRRLVGLTPQEPFVFSATVGENLALAGKGVCEKEMWRALYVAGLDQEVRSLPNGLHTELGEAGQTLSGGQRARLALARALAAGPPILLLDDPLSSVDASAEAAVLLRLAKHRRGKTTLIVSHRPAALAFAHKIYVLDQGRIVCQGNHAELEGSCPVYRRLLQRQMLSDRVEG